MSDKLLVEFSDGVLSVTLDRPEKRNALSGSMVAGIADAFARAELEADIRVVVLKGAGGDFCAGADLAELLDSAKLDLEENERDALRLGEVFLAIRRLPKPVVALVQGRALAGGAGLATACDIVIAKESASFGYPEIQRGFVPAMVMAMLTRSVGEKRAFELIATGRVVAASEALSMGLISRTLPEAEFEVTSASVISDLASHPPTAFALTKQLFADQEGRSFGDAILLGARVNALSRSTQEFKSSIAAFLER